jgi:hypothetical protein
MTVDDTLIVAGFGTGYAAMVAAIGVLWAKVNKLEAEKTELQELLGQQQSAAQLLARCPAPNCPLRDDDDPPPLHSPARSTGRVFPKSRPA